MNVKYARACDITGEGMNDGFCIQDGLMYIKYEKDMIKHLRVVEEEGYDGIGEERGQLSDEFLLKDYYDSGYYYYTEWEDEDEFQYEEINGILKEL